MRPTLNLGEEVAVRARGYIPESPERSRRTLGSVVIWGFVASVNLTLLFVLLAVLLDRYDPTFLTVLTTVGSVYGGLTGAVVGFYFGRREGDSPDE